MFVSRWNNPLILATDPNFQRDIQTCPFLGGLKHHLEGLKIIG